MSHSVDLEFEEMARDELERASSLAWRELVKVVPWGDTYDGFAPSGRPVQVERNYLWIGAPGGDVLCEVNVFANTVRYEDGARQSTLIRKPR